jgi:hypothetical protein
VWLRALVMTAAALVAAGGVAAVLTLGQAQGAWNVAGFTWSN